jgi:hypothetical protein
LIDGYKRIPLNNSPIPAPPGQSKFQYFVTGLRNQVSWKKTFTALKHPNYKLWFRGQMLSLFGTWMQRTAEGFLIF